MCYTFSVAKQRKTYVNHRISWPRLVRSISNPCRCAACCTYGVAGVLWGGALRWLFCLTIRQMARLHRLSSNTSNRTAVCQSCRMHFQSTPSPPYVSNGKMSTEFGCCCPSRYPTARRPQVYPDRLLVYRAMYRIVVSEIASSNHARLSSVPNGYGAKLRFGA